MKDWKKNLFIVWIGCFLTGTGLNLIMPFLPLYVEELGVTDPGQVSLYSGVALSSTFFVSAIMAPIWGRLADRKGRRVMLLRAALGMSIAMILMGLVSNVFQFIALRLLMGIFSGYISTANALIATQAPRHRSGYALGTLSTAAVSGVLIGPLIGGFLSDIFGVRPVFFITGILLAASFFLTLFFVRESFTPVEKTETLSLKDVFSALPNRHLIFILFFTSMMIQVSNNAVSPILTLYVRDLAGNISNIAFISGMIAAVPGVASLLAAPRLGKWGDKIGTERILLGALIGSMVLQIPMAFAETPLQFGILRFLLGIADGALLPAVQSLLSKNTPREMTGRLFGYNQSFLYIGNVVGPLAGSTIAAHFGYSSVFLAVAFFILINVLLSLNFNRTVHHKEE
ncbi:putative drug MFS efflux protein [Listeria floridensis FSL S10-1187]|uniref:Drug MFS efflux protein n=1 Tax=Listeria floridensis FSL S10-1187 TaxID=1265817 RepID=A0ABP3AY00_9LIST|nr:putative drug MFS efflux protein [Listeria floridensis FSL S10-1187]